MQRQSKDHINPKDNIEPSKQLLAADVCSMELDFSSSPALRALSIFVDKYSWDKGLVKV